MKEETIFSNFIFLKLRAEFRLLTSNAQLAMKQEFEDFTANAQEKVFLRTYAMSGMRADSDMLVWMMSADINRLQKISAKIFNSGIGKYFACSYILTGVYKGGVKEEDKLNSSGKFGKYRYMLLHPTVKTDSWYGLSEDKKNELWNRRSEMLDKIGGINENFFYSYGLAEHEMIAEREAETPELLASATFALRSCEMKKYTEKDKPVFFCIGRDLTEILDQLA